MIFINLLLEIRQQRSDFAVGSIKNVCRDCPEEVFTKADRFGITFP